MNSIAFIIHGKIRQREKIIAALKATFGKDYQLDFLITLYKDHGMELAYEAIRQGTRHIIAVGGDGSLNGVVNGLMWAKNKELLPPNEWDKIRLGVLPKGTGNDFARVSGISGDLEQLKRLIDNDNYRETDLGVVEYHTRDRVEITRYFINVTDVGLGGFVAKMLAGSSKLLGATITYQLAIISNLLTYTHQPIKMKTEDYVYEGRIMELLVANGKYFGGGLCAGPDVLTDDGLFSVVIAGKISLFTYLRNVGNLKNCRKIEHPEVKYIKAKEIFIESPYPLPVDVDGESAGYTPVKLTLIPHAIKFISQPKKQNPLR